MIQMIDNFNYSQPGYLFSIRSTITLILVNMFRLYSVDKNKADGFHSNVIINNVTNYINSKIYSKLSLNEVADKFGITPQHLCRLFKKHFNMTFTQFSNRQRVDKIRDELENIDRPIYQTYEEFDFTPQYLNSMFKKNIPATLSVNIKPNSTIKPVIRFIRYNKKATFVIKSCFLTAFYSEMLKSLVLRIFLIPVSLSINKRFLDSILKFLHPFSYIF